MKTNYSSYNLTNSLIRINDILNSSDNEYKDHNGIPSESSLTFKNGYYVDITVLFVDLRGSKELANKHKRPVLAKIYRSYISEVIAVLKSNVTINDIFIEGDGVWAVFNTTTNDHVNRVFDTAAQIASLTDILSIKFKKKGYSEIKVGIGIEDGSSLYMKAGYSGSGINEVVWIGKVVGEAAKLCNFGSRSWMDARIMLSERIYKMLDDDYKKLCEWNNTRYCYQSNAINIYMNEWVKKNS